MQDTGNYVYMNIQVACKHNYLAYRCDFVACQHNYVAYVDINKSHVNIIMLHTDIIYLACKRQKYATILI